MLALNAWSTAFLQAAGLLSSVQTLYPFAYPLFRHT